MAFMGASLARYEVRVTYICSVRLCARVDTTRCYVYFAPRGNRRAQDVAAVGRNQRIQEEPWEAV